MTSTPTTERTWTPDVRILRARIRWDVRVNQQRAADLRRMADALEAEHTDVLNPEADVYGPNSTDETVWAEFIAKRTHVLSATSGYSDLMVDRIARRMMATGDSLWHASWVCRGWDQRPCDCVPCRTERPELYR